MPARRKAPGRLGCLTRTAALTGALIAISSFIHAARAARFEGFFFGTAPPYASHMARKRYRPSHRNYWIQ
jgi:hypothetical protein